jgi:hypothetical protein
MINIIKLNLLYIILQIFLYIYNVNYYKFIFIIFRKYIIIKKIIRIYIIIDKIDYYIL